MEFGGGCEPRSGSILTGAAPRYSHCNLHLCPTNTGHLTLGTVARDTAPVCPNSYQTAFGWAPSSQLFSFQGLGHVPWLIGTVLAAREAQEVHF